METSKLKTFANLARNSLIAQVAAKLPLVLHKDSAARRENSAAVAALERDIALHSEQNLIERVAYILFNRFCALRFMDVNGYTEIGILSSLEGQFQPEILAEAKMGHIDEKMVPENICQKILALLDGKTVSRDPQGEAYRLLLIAVCNHFHKAMPFLFEKIDNYTELLMPDDLLSANSILAATREAMTAETCKNVEIIGWLYQFYISEKKDEVFAGLKKNKKVTPANIPAATQLFTPHWIVRYLVENSLGRLWMLNNPQSKLVEKMEYYIKPVEPEADFLRITKPEEIKICDPACGSGHMLVYAFDLLYAIYEEEGYEPTEIPEKILTHNLYGIEIDERAGELAAFALTMKARAKQRRFFEKPIQPNICVLENISFEEGELNEYMNFIGKKLFTSPLQNTLQQFKEADNFGSLIRPEATDLMGTLKILTAKDVSGDLFFSEIHKRVLQTLRQANSLSPKYHVVIANPPYMGGQGMNERLAGWAKNNYPNSKSDLFAMFIERNLNLAQVRGMAAMITMQSWMFLSSFEALRNHILEHNTILSMAHLGAKAFDSIGGAVVQTTAFVLKNNNNHDYKGDYLRLIDGNSEAEKDIAIQEAVKNPNCGWFYHTSTTDFKIIPGAPIAYWVSNNFIAPFKKTKLSIQDLTISDGQTKTGDNDKYLRQHWELSFSDVGPQGKWWQHPKGGSYRKWYGNVDRVIDWSEDARKHYRQDHVARIIPEYLWGKRGISWALITSGDVSFRTLEANQIFNLASPSLFFYDEMNIEKCLGFLNTKYIAKLLNVINPTISMNIGEIRCLPLLDSINAKTDDIKHIVNRCIFISKTDWNSYETSWNFITLPLLHPDYCQPILKLTYDCLHTHWQEMTLETQQLEEENNRIFIEAYGLQDELTPEVPLKEITLTCNPHYRYGGDKSEKELEAQLLADTMKEFISYAVGCMFGRYALEKPGLILANQGDTLEEYLKQIPKPTFSPSANNVIPILDEDWFPNDISELFRKFLRTTFGKEHYEENLQFIEKALGKEIRKYFLKDFYSDHLKRYKKRPIYWLFSSPSGGFNALIYMHRYRPDSVSVVLNEYLREYRTKLLSRLDHLKRMEVSSEGAKSEKVKALKEIESLKKIIHELDTWERDLVYPLATLQIAIDLDDGVKVNYAKFGAALKRIPGLDTKED